jgi:hypothetical protein
MRNKSILILLGYCIIIVGISFSSCKHDIILPDNYGYNGPCKCPDDSIPVIKEKPCSTDTVYFRNVILPLIQSSCAMSNCHDINSGGEQQPLVSYNTIRPNVVAGSASNSKLYKKLFETDPQDRMPPAPNSPLTQEQKDLIKKWIDQGAKDNYCNSCDTTTFKFSLNIWPIIRDNCKGCHSGATPSKGLLLTNYTEVKAIVDSGKLINVLNATNGLKQMPPGGKLIPCRIIQINKWIANGAPND